MNTSRKRFFGYLFILPALIFMIIFIGYPVIYNLSLSFQDKNVMTINLPDIDFIGFENYLELFKESILLDSIIHTMYYTIGCITLQFSIGFTLALLLNKKSRIITFFRGLMMIPWLIPITITGLLFKFMFSTNGGIINNILLTMNIISKPVEWLLHPSSAMWSLIIANTWIGIPFNMILLVTGLSTISPHLYESADIDGANRWQKFYYITLPSLRPAIGAVLMLGFIYTFKVFDLIYVMTKGGPVNATEVLSTFSYRLSFTEFSFSKGAGVANILFVILLLVSILYLKWLKKENTAL